MTKHTSTAATRLSILRAANHLIMTSGVAALTLDAVARSAGVSKGGLLYHFASKEKLIEGLIEHLLAEFTADIEREAGSDERAAGPGSWLRAFVRISFAPQHQALDVSAALLAAIASNPALLAPMRERYVEWQAKIEHDGIDPAIATIVRLAADGLWFAELFGFAPPAATLRAQVEQALLALTEESNP
jgi:AcrR family transcriptional regulator